MVKRRKMIFKRILSLLLVATMLLGPISAISGVISFAADGPTVSISWVNTGTAAEPAAKYSVGVPFDMTGDSPTLTANITLRGAPEGEVKVTVKTFDISATAGQDYIAVDETVTLSASNTSARVDIRVLKQITGYSFDYAIKPYGDASDYAITELFGIRITNVEGAEVDPDRDHLVGMVSYAKSLPVSINKEVSNYNTIKNERYHPDGYVYTDVTHRWSKELSDIDDDLVGLDERGSSTDSQTFNPTDAFSGNANAQYLFNRYGLTAYYYLHGKAESANKLAPKDGLNMTLTQGGADVTQWASAPSTGGTWYSFPLSDNSQLGTVELYKNQDSDNGKARWITHSGGSVTFKIQNNAELVNREVYNWGYDTQIASNSAPTVTGYYMANQTYGYGDDIYVAVRFDRAVQVTDMTIKLLVKIGEGASQQATELEYFGGALTNTLIFRKSLTDKEYVGSTVEIWGFEMYEEEVLDLFWGSNQQNNRWDYPTRYAKIDTLRCNIDTRTPMIGSDYSSGAASLPSKSHTVNVTVSNIQKGTDENSARVEYSWSESKDVSSVKSWAKSTDFNFTTGKASIVKSDGTGQYYLHVRATGMSGRSTVAVFGPYTLDNSAPTVTGFASDDYLTYAKQHTLSFNVADVGGAGLKKLYMTAYKDVDGARVVTAEAVDLFDKSLASADGGRYTVTLPYNVVGVEENSYGRYFIGIIAEDTLGNVSEIAIAPQTMLYDTRTTIETEAMFSPDFTFGGQDVYYNTEANGDKKSFEFRLTSGVAQDDVFAIRKIMKDGLEIYNGDGSYDDTLAQYGITAFVSGGYNASEAYASFTVETDSKAEGYYEFIFARTNSVGTTESGIIQIFMTARSSRPEIFSEINADNRLLINKVWRLAYGSYYQYGKESVFYTSGGQTPIFSSKEKAYEYAKYMELQDIGVLYLDQSSGSLIDQLNGNLSGEYVKASGEETVAAAGQIWIRYKSKNWNPSGSSSQHWVYYYYGSQASKPEAVDYKLFSDNLMNAIERNAKLISGYDTDDKAAENWYYLTANYTGRVDQYGQPYYDKSAVFFDDLEFTEGSGVKYVTSVKFMGDTKIYDSKITYGGERVPYLKHFDLDFSSGYGKIFIRKAGTEELTLIASKSDIAEHITVSGIYEVFEFTNGYRSYKIYVDYDKPVLKYNYVLQSGSGTSYVDRLLDGMTVQANAIELLEIIGADQTVEGYTSELDGHAYVYVMPPNGSQAEMFFTVEQLKAILEDDPDLSTLEGPGVVPNGYYTLYVSDRLGNKLAVTLRIDIDGIEVDVTGGRETDNYISFEISRTASEIVDGGFAIYRNGVLIEDTYASTFTFTSSGIYRIVIKDIYSNEYDQEFEFSRQVPNLSFYYYEYGRPVIIAPSEQPPSTAASAYVLKVSDDYYYVVSKGDIRIAFDKTYNVSFEYGSPEHTTPGYGANYMDIKADEIGWTLKVSYPNDPGVYVTVSCVPDNTPPSVDVTGTVNEYEFGGRLGKDNVLFYKTGTAERYIGDGSSARAESFTVTWSDDNPIYSVSYTLNGGEPIELAVTDGRITLNGDGKYVFTVKDILGNEKVYTFEITAEFDIDYYIGDDEAEYKLDPENYIDGDTYTDTQYTGKEVRLKVYEEAMYGFRWESGGKSLIYGVSFSDSHVFVYWLDDAYYDENGDGTDNGVRVEESFMLPDASTGGALLSAITDLPFKLRYSYDHTEGSFTLILPKTELEHEKWQFRISDAKDINPFIIQFERSCNMPSVTAKDENGTDISLSGSGYTGVNTDVHFDESEFGSDYTALVYYSENYTTDFAGVTPTALINDGVASVLDKTGYYKIVVANRYGNEQVLLIRISFEMEITVKVQYVDGAERGYTVKTADGGVFRTNKSAEFSVWELTSQITVTKDGSPFSVTVTDGFGARVFRLDTVGEYVITVTDECGNVYNLALSVKAPASVSYNGYLTGFNQNALYKDRYYTNAPIDLVYEKLSADGIGAVHYIFGDKEAKVIYDVISEKKTEYTAAGFAKCIGNDGNGAYTVVFTDLYGNKVSHTVHISSAEQLSISRLIQSTNKTSPLSLSSVISEGAWSNRRVILTDHAVASRLTVDGAVVSFVNGEYKLDFPVTMATGDVTHRVTYVDEYGNSYAFDVRLYRMVPEISISNGASLIDVKGVSYVRGPIAYSWADGSIEAACSVNGAEPVPYGKGAVLSADGLYMLTFTDRAGNTATRTVTVDTVVSYILEVDFDRVYNGITTSGVVTLRDDGDALNVVSATLNGEAVETGAMSFREHGTYVLKLADQIGNTADITFTVYNKPVGKFTYTAFIDYSITQIWHTLDGYKLSYASDIVTDAEGRHTYTFIADGVYEIELYHVPSSQYMTFSIEIDSVAPSITLVGVEDGGSTRGDVTFEGSTVGDTYTVYRDGKLYTTFVVGESAGSAPVINEAGYYEVYVSDAAGNELKYTFTREFTTNTASNAVIILLLLSVSMAGFIYLGMRGKNKIK